MSDDKKKEHPVAAVLRREAAVHQDECPAKALFTEFADAIDGHEAENAATSDGPAQVATPQYRSNWDTIFGKKQVVGQA
jgi:hypothetical protein